MLRLLFEKKGRAIWVSHLDTMRLFQRAFKRAGLLLTHTQGFNPRPSVSIALPLSVGVASDCELLDFELEGETPRCDEIKDRLNAVLIEGVTVKQVYSDGMKIKNLSLLRCAISMSYAQPLPANAVESIRNLFSSGEVLVDKKTKNGMQEQNIIPMIRSIIVQQPEDNCIEMDATICCQNPSLNPMQLVAAIDRYLPKLKPDQIQCCRMELYNINNEIFR